MKINIHNEEWEAKLVPAHDPSLYVENLECAGATWMQSHQICISDELAGSSIRRTVIHELVHAFIYSTQAVRPENYTEEDICELFSIYGDEIIALADAIIKELYSSK